MSRGNPVTPVRLTPDQLARIDEEVERQNRVRPEEPYDRSSWIRMAIEERLAKLARGRKNSKRRRVAAGGQVGGD